MVSRQLTIQLPEGKQHVIKRQLHSGPFTFKEPASLSFGTNGNSLM